MAEIKYRNHIIISIIPCSVMQKMLCPSYLFCNFPTHGSLELSMGKRHRGLIGW